MDGGIIDKKWDSRSRLSRYSAVELFNLAVALGMATELSSLFREEGVNQGRQIPEFNTLFVNAHPVGSKF